MLLWQEREEGQEKMRKIHVRAHRCCGAAAAAAAAVPPLVVLLTSTSRVKSLRISVDLRSPLRRNAAAAGCPMETVCCFSFTRPSLPRGIAAATPLPDATRRRRCLPLNPLRAKYEAVVACMDDDDSC